jgi:Fe-S-cluster-containing hydrogenase component 2
MANQPTDSTQKGISRRNFLITGGGAGVAGLVVGGIGGRELFPKALPVGEVIPLPTTWIGRNFAACTGCRNCEIACSQHFETKVWLSASRIQVYEAPPGIEFPVTCYQCDEARCVASCPEAALTQDPASSTIIVDTKKCLRTAKNGECTKCADACPGSTILFHPTSSAPMFCDLCGGDPECVKVCPDGALMKNGLKQAAIGIDEIAAGMRKPFEVKPAPAAGAKSSETASVFKGPATA